MTPTPKRAEPRPADRAAEPLELTSADYAAPPAPKNNGFSRRDAAPSQPPAGARCSECSLACLRSCGSAYSSWSAGRTLGGQPLSSPLVAQWLAIAAGPLALLALAWLMFGRTRRREAEMFTRSVIAMRAEAQSLEALLAVLSQRINDSRTELTMMTQQLMQLGDETTGKLGGITQEFDSSSEKLRRTAKRWTARRESARNDIAVLLDDLPRAEETARERVRAAALDWQPVGRTSRRFGEQVSDLAERTRERRRADRRRDRAARRAPRRNRQSPATTRRLA